MSSTHKVSLVSGYYLAIFAVGGGGSANGLNSGSSGFFGLNTEAEEKMHEVRIHVGSGGSGGLNGGATTVSIDGTEVLRAPGGDGSGRPGWSGGTNYPPAGFNGSRGSSFSGNGNGAGLPELCGIVFLSPGSAGNSSDGPGAGGVIVDGQKPTRLDSRDGEGYGAGGGEDYRDGYSGAVLLTICKKSQDSTSVSLIAGSTTIAGTATAATTASTAGSPNYNHDTSGAATIAGGANTSEDVTTTSTATTSEASITPGHPAGATSVGNASISANATSADDTTTSDSTHVATTTAGAVIRKRGVPISGASTSYDAVTMVDSVTTANLATTSADVSTDVTTTTAGATTTAGVTTNAGATTAAALTTNANYTTTAGATTTAGGNNAAGDTTTAGSTSTDRNTTTADNTTTAGNTTKAGNAISVGYTTTSYATTTDGATSTVTATNAILDATEEASFTTKIYTGTASVTSSGRPCQLWSSTTPHNHLFTGVGHHNYCRNPNDARGGVWCFTSDPSKEWEYCAVPKCYSGEFL